MWIVAMAFRNIRRNRRRTLLAVSSITLSVMLMSFMYGLANGVLQNLVKNITKNESGHIRITTQGFDERARFMPLDELVLQPEELLSRLREDATLSQEIQYIAPRITFGTLLSSGPTTVVAMGIAGDAEVEQHLLNLDRSIVQGRYLGGNREVILGYQLAEKLGLTVGDTLRILTQGADSSLRLRNFTIVGLFKTGLTQMDRTFFQIPLEDAREFLRTGGGVQQILIMLRDYTRAPEIARRVAQLVVPVQADLLVKPWTEIGDYPRLIKMMETIYGVIYWVIAFLGALIISNILMMVVLERRREIGILKAMGLKKREILALFISEGLAMGIVGSGVGALLGLGICYLFSIVGIDYTSAMSGLTFPMDPIFYTVVSIPGSLMMFGIGVLVSLLVSYLPSRRAAQLDPVIAIRSVV